MLCDKRTWRRMLGLMTVLMLVTQPMLATELTWTGGGGIFFDDGGNWNPAQSPSGTDNLTFGATASKYSLIVAGTPSVNEMRFLGGSYTMEGGSGSNLSSDDTWVDGGSLTATGSNTAWGSSDNITVGDLATGTLNVESGALVTHLGLFLGQTALGQGTVNVTGTSSTLGTSVTGSIGRIGVNGTGTMNVTAGGRSDMSSALLGQFAGASGTLNVDGAGSDFVTHNFDTRAGDAGTGHINVTNGGRIHTTGNGNLIAGNVPGSQGTISFDNGVANVGSRIYVGREGTGSFSATSGSTINSNLQFILGESESGVGTATLNGAGTLLNIGTSNHDLVVGWHGLGQMSIQNGASALIPDDVLLGYQSESTGDNRLEITGGSQLTFGTVSSDGTFNAGYEGNATLHVSGGSTVSGRAVDIATIAGSTAEATFAGQGTAAHLQYFTVANEGTATATVSGGAQINVNTNDSAVANVFVGDSGAGVGTLTISGSDGMGTASAVVSNKRIEIGGSNNDTGGRGTVNIAAGGQLDTNGGVLGHSSGGTGGDGTVGIDGAGSHWNSTGGALWVGFTGPGRMNITGGGSADVTELRMGNPANAEASELVLDGTGSSMTVAGTAYLGEGRAASVDIKHGATLFTATDGTSIASIGHTTSADGAEVTIDNGTWNHGGSRIRVGHQGGSAAAPSTVRVKNGGTLDNSGLLMIADSHAGSHGVVEVTGSGSTLYSSHSNVGDQGTGTLNVRNGGHVTLAENLDVSGVTSGRGTVQVAGTGSRIDVGGEVSVGRDNGSIGTLDLLDGGQMSTGDFRIAEHAGSTGTVNAHAGGLLNVEPGFMLTVGGSNGSAGGNGTLNVQGGLVSVANDTVAVTNNGTVNLSTGTLRVATLTRASGGDFNFTGGKLNFTGNQVLDAAALANIFNASPTLNDNMTLQVDGAAALDAPLRLNGGTFAVGSVADISNLDWDRGTFQLTATNLSIDSGGLFGSQLLLGNDQHLVVDQSTTNNGLINATGASLSFLGGMTNNADMVLFNSTVRGPLNSVAGSTVTVLGETQFIDQVRGSADFSGPGMATFGGGYRPGDSTAIVSFEGDLSLQNSNTLFIEIGGNDNSSFAQYDQLVVDGFASLDGMLDVELVDLGSGTYQPQQGDSFAILSASGGFGGAFSSLSLPTLGGGLDWELNPGGNTLFLDVVLGGMLTGDFDNDGDLDGHDVDALVGVVAAMSHDPTFDLNGDGDVNSADLQDWLAEAGSVNLPSGNPYLEGDANLDGIVDGLDFIAWNGAKFTSIAAWTAGDFTADGVVDGLDFISWNANKFTSADGLTAVPEPHGILLLLAGLGLVVMRRRG